MTQVGPLTLQVPQTWDGGFSTDLFRQYLGCLIRNQTQGFRKMTRYPSKIRKSDMIVFKKILKK